MAAFRSSNSAPPKKPFWGGRATLLVLVFAITGGAVYWVGEKSTSTTARFTAEARVYLANRQGLSAEVIQQEILLDPFLESLLDGETSPVGAVASEAARGSDTTPRSRQDFRVTAELMAGSGQWRTTIAYTGSDAAQATRLVNRVAEHFAAIERAASVLSMPAAAGQAADGGRADFERAQAELDRFLQEHFARLQQRTEPSPSADANRSPSGKSTTPWPPAGTTAEKPSMVENPQWVELNNRIAQLEQQRAELLLSRTAMHPSVQDLEGELARLEQQLKGLSRQIPAEEGTTTDALATRPLTSPPDAADPQPVAQNDVTLAKRFEELRQAVEQAKQRCQEVAQSDRQNLPSGPPLEIQLADGSRRLQGAQDSQRWLLVAMAAGLAMAAGAGMVSMGMVEQPLLSATEAQAALPVPVVGVISTQSSEPTRVVPTGSQALAQSLLLISGVALMVICLGIVTLFAR